MFYLDRKSSLDSSVAREDLYLWRYIPSYKYKFREGRPEAKPGAFNIKRDDRGIPREPSASLFELTSDPGCNEKNSIAVLVSLIRYKGFKNLADDDASGSLRIADMIELSKDPKVFQLSKTNSEPAGSLAHWDLKYEADDKTEIIQAAKSSLAHICRVYISGGKALSHCAHTLL
ncbi:hypothetical protein [Pseudomonas viridiflava]|nr:hypothetical protein [Pseudomonas viridiflava]